MEPYTSTKPIKPGNLYHRWIEVETDPNSLWLRILPRGMTQEEVLENLHLLVQLTDMSYKNTTELSRLQAVLDLNKISAHEALKEVMHCFTYI